MKLKPTAPVPTPLSPRLLRAKVACSQAQARYDALSKDPAALAWLAVMDALFELVSS